MKAIGVRYKWGLSLCIGILTSVSERHRSVNIHSICVGHLTESDDRLLNGTPANVLPTATSLSGRIFKKIVRIPWTGFWMRSAPTIPECPLDSYVGNCFPSRHGQTWVAAPVSNIKLRSFHVECLFHLLVPTEETFSETERTYNAFFQKVYLDLASLEVNISLLMVLHWSMKRMKQETGVTPLGVTTLE